MIVFLTVKMPDDFYVKSLTVKQRNKVIKQRMQDALDREYPNAPMGTVCVSDVASSLGETK